MNTTGKMDHAHALSQGLGTRSQRPLQREGGVVMNVGSSSVHTPASKFNDDAMMMLPMMQLV